MHQDIISVFVGHGHQLVHTTQLATLVTFFSFIKSEKVYQSVKLAQV